MYLLMENNGDKTTDMDKWRGGTVQPCSLWKAIQWNNNKGCVYVCMYALETTFRLYSYTPTPSVPVAIFQLVLRPRRSVTYVRLSFGTTATPGLNHPLFGFQLFRILKNQRNCDSVLMISCTLMSMQYKHGRCYRYKTMKSNGHN